MYGKVECQDGSKPREEIISIDGIAFAVIRFPKEKKQTPRMIRRVAKKWIRLGVRQILLPRDMQAVLWEKYHLTPISVVALREQMAGEIVRCYLREQGICASQSALVLYGEYVTGSVLRCAEQLCRTVRYCSLCFTYGAEGAARWLCKSYGVAVRVMQRIDETATLCICFSKEPPTVMIPTLNLSDPDLHVDYSDGRDEPLLAALLQSGVLAVKTLRVKGLTFSPEKADN